MSNKHGYDAECQNGEMDDEPELLDVVRTSDLHWNVYALGADGARRSSWHTGDEQPQAGVTFDNRFFNWWLADLPPKRGERLFISAGFSAQVAGSSKTYDLRDAESAGFEDLGLFTAYRYEKTFHFPAANTVTVSPMIALVTSPPAPIMNGVRAWYRRDDQPWAGPVAVWRDDDLSGLLTFNVPTTGATLEIVYLPMEFEWGGPGRDRIVAKSATHLVSRLVIDAAPAPEPAKEQPACSAPPGAPVIDEYYRFDEGDVTGSSSCAQFKIALPGAFGLSWDEVPGAVKYRIKMSSPGGMWIFSQELDRRAARCNGTICSFQTVPPWSPATGCVAMDGSTIISGYYFFVSAIDSCGQEGPIGAGAEGYLGPYSDR
jgi:hypothetical protein